MHKKNPVLRKGYDIKRCFDDKADKSEIKRCKMI